VILHTQKISTVMNNAHWNQLGASCSSWRQSDVVGLSFCSLHTFCCMWT